jgi:pimeloyl-ACP methyl ester carboxylesterase
VAFIDCVGPFVVPDAGHFLQWEQAGVLNRALAHFCR